jgi:hypothetical protein
MKELSKETNNTSDDRDNLLFNYNVFLETKKLNNITNPNDDDIKRMGLHWTAWKFKVISDNLNLIEDFLNEKINLTHLKENSNVDSLETFFQKGKSSDEIFAIFDKIGINTNDIFDNIFC